MRRLLAVVLLAAMGLAGCSDDAGDAAADAGATGGGVHGGHDAGRHLLAPTWEVGDWWTWTSDQAGSFTYVVAQDAGADWVMATDNGDIAFFDVQEDISFLGPVRKSDLAGSQGDKRVEFFRFPLTAQKNWTTTWDDLPVTIQVLAVANGKASLESRLANGTRHASYTFDAKLGYFGEASFYAADGETVAFGSKVTASGKSFAGDLVSWDVDTIYRDSGDISGAGSASSLDVPLTVTDVYAELTIDCVSGTFVAGVAPLPVVTTVAGVDDRGVGSDSGACPLTMAFEGPVGAPRQAVPGSSDGEQWGYSAMGSPASVGTFTFNIFLRTQTLSKVGEAP